MSQLKRCPQCQYSLNYCVTTSFNLECGYCGFVIGNIQPLWKAITHPHCIVTKEDSILDSGLSLAQAEKRLQYYLEHKEDCYIGLTLDFADIR